MEQILNDIKRETSWHKRAILVEIYHSYQCSQHGTKRGEKWTVRKTAEATGLSYGNVDECIQIAKRFPNYRDIGGNMTREDAMNIIRMENKK